MKKAWLSGLDTQQEEDMRGSYIAALLMRKKLEELLQERMTSSHLSLCAKNLFDSPNWALVQAEGRGYERALHEITQLLK